MIKMSILAGQITFHDLNMSKERKEIEGHPFIKYYRETYDEEIVRDRSQVFFEWLDKRRTVRDFSDKPIPREVIENIIKYFF